MPNITEQFRDITTKFKVPNNNGSGTEVAPAVKRKETKHSEFMKEAYRIWNHIENLRSFLLSTRRAYVNLSSSSRISTSSLGNAFSTTDSTSVIGNLPTNGTITYLTDKERDEIDFQAKVIIRQCMDRIKELEEAEAARQKAFKSVSIPTWIDFFASVLTPPSSDNFDILAAHHSGVTWLLNKRLVDVSKIQKDQQEMRLMRQVEKQQNTLPKPPPNSNPKLKPVATTSKQQIPTPAPIQQLLDAQHQAMSRPSSRNSQTASRNSNNPSLDTWIDPNSDEEDFESTLDPTMRAQLQAENEQLMNELEGTMEQVKQVESALLEISSMQSQIIAHLAAQTEVTERLQDEALIITERVETGNIQLMRARERNATTRKWILMFLLLMSGVLLFLDWYG